MTLKSRQSRGGVLMVALVLVLVFFGVLAGMQTLIVVQASLVTRALAVEHLRAEYRHRVKLALQEAGQQALEARSPALFPGRFARLLEGLACPVGTVRGEALGDLSLEGSWLPILELKARPLLEAGAALPFEYPALRLRATDRVELGRPTECRVSLNGVAGEGSREVVHFEFRSVGVPLCLKPLCFYELPEEIGLTMEEVWSPGRGLGFRSRAGGPEGGDLRAAQALPYHFRARVSLAQTYASLFSNEAVACLLAAAGPEGFASMREGRVTGGGGFVEMRERGPVLDLSMAGTSRLQVVAAQDAVAELSLEERVPGVRREPLVLLVLGQAKAPLRVRLGSCSRPVLLVGIHVVVSAAAGTQWRGGLLLAPGSSLAEGTEGLRVSHFSGHPGSVCREGMVCADLPADGRLADLYPRTYYAVVRPLLP